MSAEPGLRERFFAEGKLADCPIYDLHGHMGPFYGIHFPLAGTDAMVAAMERAGVTMLVFCHHAALFAPEIGNAANIEAVRKHPGKLRAYCAINPNYPEITARDTESFDQHADVYAGFKFLADYHGFPITDERYQPAWEMADDRELLVLMHTWGGSQLTGPAQVRSVAERYPEARILLGHSIHGDWESAAGLAREFPNVYLELTAVLDERGILEMFVERCGSEKVVFGTDFPWFDHFYYIGAVLGADITDEDRRNVFYRNAERLLNITR